MCVVAMLSTLLTLVLFIELIIGLGLSIPVGRDAKISICVAIRKSMSGQSSAKSAYRVAVGFLSVVLVSASLNLVGIRSQAKIELASNAGRSMQTSLELLEASRDWYLAVSCLFLLLLIFISVDSLLEIHRLSISNSALERQAKQVSASYQFLLEEKISSEKRTQQRKGAQISSSGSLEGSLEIPGRDSELSSSKRISELERLLDSKQQKILSQQSELQAILKQKNSLLAQLKDYEFMFGDQRKKNN